MFLVATERISTGYVRSRAVTSCAKVKSASWKVGGTYRAVTAIECARSADPSLGYALTTDAGGGALTTMFFTPAVAMPRDTENARISRFPAEKIVVTSTVTLV